MGQSSSTDQVSPEQREAESLAASTGALPILEKAFSQLSDPQTNLIPLNSLQKCFSLTSEKPIFEAAAAASADFPPGLLEHFGDSVVDLFFLAEGGGVSWVEFLRGYTECCRRVSSSTSFNNLFRVFVATVSKAGLPAKMQFESNDDDCKMDGFVFPADLAMLLWLCWVLSSECGSLKTSIENKGHFLPDVNHLVSSAVLSCSEVGNNFDVYESDILKSDVQLPALKVHMWALKTVPNLPDCFAQFIYARLQNPVVHEDKLESSCSSVCDVSLSTKCSSYLLTCGRAWAISLTARSSVIREETLKACFSTHTDDTNGNLLYRSSLHGRGLNRFWSNVEGYNGPLLVLISSSSGNDGEGNKDVKRWIIGALTDQGFENKDAFYGSSGSLYAISPAFHVFTSLGKEKNFVYSHLHPTRYDPHPKPVGIGFGGSISNERIFLDEDFARVTIRHHAGDKTYQPGSLVPNQGFLPLEASVVEVEVWGLGGRRVEEAQTSYKKREELFTEQRRKVDLKTFSNWEDSPEKMMMDMVSDPNAVRREDR